MLSVALITGSSQGLGEEFAKLLAADGENLVLVARSEEKLNELSKELSIRHGIRVFPVPEDLSAEGAIDRLMAILEREELQVTTLINNAGIGGYGKFHLRDWSEDAHMIHLNVLALAELTRKILPTMLKAKEGSILNVASTAAFPPGPLMAVYYATKAFVLSFSEAIREELKGTGVNVTCLCPGPTKTGFAEHAELQGSRLFRGSIMDAKTVATIGYKGMLKGRALVIPGWRNWILMFGVRLVPLWVSAKIARRAQEKRL
jgi:short-subunit dehydrogenase